MGFDSGTIENKLVHHDWNQNQLYNRVRQDIMDNTQGFLSEKAQGWINYFADRNGRAVNEVLMNILEKFNEEQGALPDRLKEEYVSVIFSAVNIQKKMAEGNLTFREAAAILAANVKKKKIFLDEEAVNQAIKTAEMELAINPVDVERE